MREMIIMPDWLRNLSRHLANDIASIWHRFLDFYIDHVRHIALAMFAILVILLFSPELQRQIPKGVSGNMALLSVALMALYPFAMRRRNRR